MSDYSITSPAGQRMMSYLPKYYESSRVTRALQQARGNEVDMLRQAMDETLNQFFVRTSTWKLGKWEEELGLTPEPGITDAQRQDRIISRLRGYGTCTIKLVKQVAEAYDNGTVDVFQDHTIYKTTVRFVDTLGVPPNIDDLKRAVREVVPAHFDLFFEYNYLIWTEWEDMVLTWDEMDVLNKTWDESEVWT